MKSALPLLVLLFISFSSFAQPAATTSATWKDKVIGKWKYLGTEQFGVVDSPKAEQQNDWLEINSDGTYLKVEDAKASKGTYIISQSANTITFKNAAGKSKMYYLKKSVAGKLTIEFQTPDLIRTRYTYELEKP